ncbi:apoptosis facilitator Bcl-2-like protein 14 [Xiphias gladius]|uniref:apoptosis facilitator Bcl-2-like protein 14 n=1 Tax=Xiphias gladius TaxID=8245 RepID=UPI001A9997EC|nr:apoptosis facilitator Bcl-2-like protein 14 [Xiphias gladius]
MANGRVDIHDIFSNQNDLKSGTDGDPTSASDTDGMEDTVEFRLMMAYAQRRRPKKDAESPKQDCPVKLNGNADANGTSSPQTPAKTGTELTEETTKKKKKKKRRGWKGLLCIKPQPDDDEPHQRPEAQCCASDRYAYFQDDEVIEDNELKDVAFQLTKLASEIPFTPPDLETDAPDDEVEKLIGLLLRESGDKVNEQMLKEVKIAKELFHNYSFFKTVITTLLMRMGLRTSNPDSPGPCASPKAQIAVTCEATRRFSTMDTLPTSRLLGFGARYLIEHYSSWVQEQGGYDAAFQSDDEDEIQ